MLVIFGIPGATYIVCYTSASLRWLVVLAAAAASCVVVEVTEMDVQRGQQALPAAIDGELAHWATITFAHAVRVGQLLEEATRLTNAEVKLKRTFGQHSTVFGAKMKRDE